ncbi:DUF2087 domain-containing protein [Ignavigranum ruoffiae]
MNHWLSQFDDDYAILRRLLVGYHYFCLSKDGSVSYKMATEDEF